MRIGRRGVVGVVVGLLMVACGEETPHVQQAAATPLTESSVGLQQTGDAAVTVVPGSVRYRLDDARLLEVTLTVRSTARGEETVTVRGSFLDKGGRLIGDASGGELDVAAGGSTEITLSGPAPNGTIASGRFEITTIPAATPVSG